MTLSNDLIEPQQWYRWHDRGPRMPYAPQHGRQRRFHFGDIVVRDLNRDGVGADDATADLRSRGFGDVSITFRCHGIVRVEGERLTMAQLAEDESLLTFTVRVTAPDDDGDRPSAEIVAQFMTGDFAGLDTADPSAALTDFELRARAEALAYLQHGDPGVDGAQLARQLAVSQRRLHAAFRNTGNSVRAMLNCD